MSQKLSVIQLPQSVQQGLTGYNCMSSKVDLSALLEGLHTSLAVQLKLARETISHPTAKGDASEGHWLGLLDTYLPKRYQVTSAFVVDSQGQCSDQIDIVVYDRQYSPLIFNHGGTTYLPAESIYAAFEVKQSATAENIGYAQRKVASVRALHRTSLPIPHAGGTTPAKEPQTLLGGLLCLDSCWTPAFGDPFKTAISSDLATGRLDLSCVATAGLCEIDEKCHVIIHDGAKALTLFLLRLISLLQEKATVPMIDIMAYAKWLR